MYPVKSFYVDHELSEVGAWPSCIVNVQNSKLRWDIWRFLGNSKNFIIGENFSLQWSVTMSLENAQPPWPDLPSSLHFQEEY